MCLNNVINALKYLQNISTGRARSKKGLKGRLYASPIILYCSAYEELSNEITQVNNTLEDCFLNPRSIQNGITLQLNVVYSLVTQTDSPSNLDVAINSASIARANDGDSSAMKAIAVITAFFLGLLSR